MTINRLKTKKVRSPKLIDPCKIVREFIALGAYRETSHCILHRKERNLSLPAIIYVLKYGRHEKAKDEYKEEFLAWNYAIRGKTIDDEEIRVAVYFENNLLMIATVIRLAGS